MPVVVKINCCWGNCWAPAGCPARSGWGNIAVGWKKGVPGGKPYAVGANGIYLEKGKKQTRIYILHRIEHIQLNSI